MAAGSGDRRSGVPVRPREERPLLAREPRPSPYSRPYTYTDGALRGVPAGRGCGGNP